MRRSPRAAERTRDRVRVTGALLVGGASSRFGSPKALAPFAGQTLAERAWRTLGEASDERIAVGKASDGLALPFSVVDDGSDVRAAVAGVVAALRLAAHDVCVVLPVDTPLVTPDLLRGLAEACADAACPADGPLPAAFRQTALPLLERRLHEGRLALHDALSELDVRRLPVDRELLVNVNRPEDLDVALAVLRRMAPRRGLYGEQATASLDRGMEPLRSGGEKST